MQSLIQPGDPMRYTAPNGVTVAIHVTDTGVYARTVYTGSYRHHDLSAAHADERVARSEARRISQLAKDGMNADAIADVLAAESRAVVQAAEQAAAPTGLLALKVLAEPRQVRGTIAGAHLADITEPQQHALDTAAQTGGTIRRGKAFPLPVLRALARKQFGTLNYAANTGRRKVVESLTLNSRGWREAATA